MRVERFKASTMREALDKIKVKLGEDAVILHSRSVNNGIEVIAAQDSDQSGTGNTWLDDVLKKDEDLRTNRNAADLKKRTEIGTDESEFTYNRQGKNKQNDAVKDISEKESNADLDKLMESPTGKPAHRDLSHMTIEQLEQATKKATEFSELLKAEIQSGQDQRRLWIEHEKQLDILKQEMIDLKESLLRQELRELKQRAENLRTQKKSTTVKSGSKHTRKSDHPFYNKVKTRLVEKGIIEQTAGKIVSRIKLGADSLDLELSNQSHIHMLKNILSNEIKKLIPVYHSQNDSGKQKVLSIFGPRNSGKTLTSIKLALQALLINNKKAALILIGELENMSTRYLTKLSKIAKIPLVLISTTSELKKALHDFADKDIIVIDYAVDLNSKNQVNKLVGFLSVTQSSEKHLIIPANIKQPDIQKLKQTVKNFSYKSIILTKMDELKKIGIIINVVHQFGKPVSYICTGETIPDDIEIANAAKLTHMILKG